jgi:hypothetical protein
MRYLKARGHVERCGDRDLIRPVGIRPPELPLGSKQKHGKIHGAAPASSSAMMRADTSA